MKNLNILLEEAMKIMVERISDRVAEKMNIQKPIDDDVFLNINQASEHTALKISSIYGLVHKNKIPFHKKGKLYFLKSELTEWLKSGKDQSKQEIEEKADEYLSKNRLF